ncbi:hypothetical protein OUO20_13675 [Arthrobacter sp. FX8]|uniref:hypothetical protein n=1 Tax=Arthrobacter sp. FX8 TaxID=2997335 RepID=UPI00227B5792|nr:hypothetical protein [Arthrobacter sp. FX8]WAJ32208.1 hypothetical protein OUO20_13675 [Arthrobacter sp. FX8]
MTNETQTETKTIEDLNRTAKATLLEAIAEAAYDEARPDALEALARAYAAVAANGPTKGEVPA